MTGREHDVADDRMIVIAFAGDEREIGIGPLAKRRHEAGFVVRGKSRPQDAIDAFHVVC